jgi:hypothetical protein
MTRLFFICSIKTDWKERDFEAGLKFNAEQLDLGLFLKKNEIEISDSDF